MRPKERRDSGQKDLFRARLDQIADMGHPLAKLAATIDCGFLEQRFGAVYADVPGRPPLPTRLMAGLAILKHMHDLSDEALCERWVENPYFQLFCGATIKRVVADRGYRGHNAPEEHKFRVFISARGGASPSKSNASCAAAPSSSRSSAI
jgi:hypothetical protein